MVVESSTSELRYIPVVIDFTVKRKVFVEVYLFKKKSNWCQYVETLLQKKGKQKT